MPSGLSCAPRHAAVCAAFGCCCLRARTACLPACLPASCATDPLTWPDLACMSPCCATPCPPHPQHPAFQPVSTPPSSWRRPARQAPTATWAGWPSSWTRCTGASSARMPPGCSSSRCSRPAAQPTRQQRRPPPPSQRCSRSRAACWLRFEGSCPLRRRWRAGRVWARCFLSVDASGQNGAFWSSSEQEEQLRATMECRRVATVSRPNSNTAGAVCGKAADNDTTTSHCRQPQLIAGIMCSDLSRPAAPPTPAGCAVPALWLTGWLAQFPGDPCSTLVAEHQAHQSRPLPPPAACAHQTMGPAPGNPAPTCTCAGRLGWNPCRDPRCHT